MPVAVMESVVGGRVDLDTFQVARRLGFSGVEIELARRDLRSPHEERLASLLSAKAASSLPIPSLVLGEHNDGGLASPTAAVRLAAAEDVRVAIRWARELGADVILVPFFLENEVVSETAFDRCVSAFQALCPESLAAGVVLCFEGTLSADRLRLLAERVGSAGFGCYFDLANPLPQGLDPATEIRELGGLIRRVHVKDSRVARGDCRPGEGRVDFEGSARALAEIGYEGWLVLETPPAPPPVLARDLSFTRSVFPALAPPVDWPRFGAFSYEFDGGEWDRLADTFRGLGLVAVQLGSGLLDECLAEPEHGAASCGRLEEQGVAVAGLAAYRNLIAPDPQLREQNIELVARCLELAPLLGTWVVATETGTRSREGDWIHSQENWSEDAWSALEDALERLLPVAERSGTVLALEGHVKHVLRTHSRLIRLFERFPSPHLGLVCDPYNYIAARLLPAQEQVTCELLDHFEHRFVLAHGKDVAAGGADVGTVELGTGVFDQRPYLEFLRTKRPDLPLILEHLPLEHVPQAIQSVSRTPGG